MDQRKLLQKALLSPHNLAFRELVTLVEAFGFHLARVSGSHHIFVHPDIREPVNLQNVHGQAKAYQVRQVLRIVEWYNLTLGDDHA